MAFMRQCGKRAAATNKVFFNRKFEKISSTSRTPWSHFKQTSGCSSALQPRCFSSESAGCVHSSTASSGKSNRSSSSFLHTIRAVLPSLAGLGIGFGLMCTTSTHPCFTASTISFSPSSNALPPTTSSDLASKAQPSSLATIECTPAPGTPGGPVITKSGRFLSKLRIFVGYDTREDLAYEVCRHSILKFATIPVEIVPIKQIDLRKAGLYLRSRDPTESTEFSFTRFLTPYLAGFEGWAMFVDCDFLYTADVRELAELIDDRYAIMCVQHDHTPKTATKMDGVVQTAYPRKNWSSMVLYNCAHPKNRVLTPSVVNSQSGAFLHRFMWLDDADIGSIPFTWNFLVGHNEVPKDGKGRPAIPPKAIHYTSGGPWFEAWKNCELADLWFQEREELRRTHMIQKVIQDDFLKLLHSGMDERARDLEGKILEVEGRVSELAALQRLLLFYLQEKMPPSVKNSNGKEKAQFVMGNSIGNESSFEA